MTVKSRTSLALNVWTRPSALTPVRSPVVASTSRWLVTIRTLTYGLVGVSNGSPWFGRSKAIRRLTQGSQRYRSRIPFALVNIQFEPARLVRARAA